MEVKAIDVHVHLCDELTLKSKGARVQQMARYFKRERKPVSIDEMADQYRQRKMMAVIMNTTDVSVTGLTPVPNDHIAEGVRKHPDVFLGFGIVDPWHGKTALQEIRRCKEELGLHGIGEFNPARQHFFPNDPRFYPLWEETQRLGLPILFHSGMAAAGAGTPGGMGIKLKYSQPIYLDDVAADFPELKIISAHPSWPWQEESLAIARHKSNFFIDLSGWAPKYFPKELVQHVNSLLQDKVMFGSDWPALSVERWMEEFEKIDFKPEVRQKILLENAKKFFGLNLT
ncbi:MAG: amidohydrolase family protein [Deltaproteobacteria bacterium]|nr:amidohydrolase family protein [Deltaproteobacteria bacterium]